ncbi:MAG: ribosome recycling factor [Bacilli bacterium]|jgi:ribosome recycling factor
MSKETVKALSDSMQKTVETFQKELNSIRTGRANASLLDLIKVEYYGFPTPLSEIAQVSVPEARQIMIKPYERESLKMIEKAIIEANLGMMPNNDGTVIRLNIPALSQERRKELVKLLGKLSEEAKVAIRNIRRNANEGFKKDKTIPEDQKKREEADVQKTTDEFIRKIDALASAKEKDIMSI